MKQVGCSYPVRLLFCLALTAMVYITPLLVAEDGSLPYYFYVLLIAVLALHRIALYAMFVAIMSFFARISDPVCTTRSAAFL